MVERGRICGIVGGKRGGVLNLRPTEEQKNARRVRIG